VYVYMRTCVCVCAISNSTHTHTHNKTSSAHTHTGEADQDNNVLKGAPHTADMLTDVWERPYSRERAVYPAAYLKKNKFWPYVGRIDNVYGDRHLVCKLEK